MKLFAMLLSVSIVSTDTPGTLVVMDRAMNNPAVYMEDFTLNNYFKKQFPVYTADLDVVVEAAEKAAKILSQSTGEPLAEVISANHTTFKIAAYQDSKAVSVRFTTTLENGVSYSFELVRLETIRTAQRKLLDLAAYLSSVKASEPAK